VRVDNHHHCEPPVIGRHSDAQRSYCQRIRKAGHRTPPPCALQSRPILPSAMAPAISLAIWARSKIRLAQNRSLKTFNLSIARRDIAEASALPGPAWRTVFWQQARRGRCL
jgi:hypothetical protein